MSRVCQLTGKRPQFGYRVSHSNRRTPRKFLPNIVKKRFYIPEENRWITLKISTSALKTINKKGLYNYLQELRRKGIKI